MHLCANRIFLQETNHEYMTEEITFAFDPNALDFDHNALGVRGTIEKLQDMSGSIRPIRIINQGQALKQGEVMFTNEMDAFRPLQPKTETLCAGQQH